MNRAEIKDLRDRVQTNIQDLIEKMDRAFKPQSLKGGTSYKDYDTIHGTRKELDIVKLGQELFKLRALKDTYDYLLANVEIEVDEKEVLDKLKTNCDKVKFLRIGREHTQQEVADILLIGLRTVQRIEREIRREVIPM